ncbi:unnamed protein product [Cladocopium goreaui]|uniref:Pentatricopeptide repeat-containing protein, chloroplastic n=1 Tax=Cladocopium goreaui TaxID=2562237 RepID=A0A9P1CFJ3_9DINO|nr:unnamed protein product [Cladocopium goreaui]
MAQEGDYSYGGEGDYSYGGGQEDYSYGNGGYEDYSHGHGPETTPDMVQGAQLPLVAPEAPLIGGLVIPVATHGGILDLSACAGQQCPLRTPYARPQYELAVLFAAAASLSEFYIQVEENIVAQEGFVKMLRGYVAEQTVPNVTASWNLVSIGRDGLHRKLMRSHQLIRFAELLPIFPEVPPDSLIWDYVDVINNQSAPKACYIAFSATKIKRSDVLLQYHKAEAIIEHVGDVSSLEGKVQRIHDDYFKKHNLLSTLFDNPAADIYPGGNLDQSTSTQLQALYGVHGNSPSMGGAPAVSLGSTIFMDLVGKAVLEVVFRKPVSVRAQERCRQVCRCRYPSADLPTVVDRPSIIRSPAPIASVVAMGSVAWYTAAMGALRQRAGWQETLQLMEELEARHLADVITCTACVGVLGKVAMWRRALEVLKRLEKQSIEPDVVIYNATMSACERSGEWQQALSCLCNMPGHLQADVVSYNATISACEKGNQWQSAWHLFHQISQHHLQPTIISFNACISACGKGKQWHFALHLLSEMQRSRRGNEVSFASACDACARSSQWQQALISAAGRGVVAQSAAVSACEKMGKWQHAILLLSDLRQRHLKLDCVIYGAAISCCEKAQQWQRALVLMEEIDGSIDLDLVTMNAAMSACSSSAQWHATVTLFQRLGDRDLEADVISYSAVISSCEFFHWQWALSFLDEALARLIQLDVIAYASAITACARGAQWPQAVQLFGSSRRAAKMVNDVAVDMAIRACEKSKKGKLELVLELLQELQEDALKNPRCGLVTFAAKKAGLVGNMLEHCDPMTFRGVRHQWAQIRPELADPDFDFVFPNAELSVGRARTGAVVAPTTGLRGKLALPAKGFCSVYEPLTNFSGREVFWRSPTSRPAANVECVKVTLLEAPKSSVIIRTIRVRSAKSVRRLESDSEAPVVVVAKPRSWQAEMKSWAQRVTVAFAAGGLAGTLGLAVTMLPWFPSPKSRRRSKVSQA